MDEKYELELAAERVPTLINNATNHLIEICGEVEKAKKKAQTALEKAEEATDIKTRWIFNAESINKLKDASFEIAKSVEQSINAQVKMQEYQKVLTQYTTEILQLTLLGPAACDRALDQLREITSQHKSDKQLDSETKKQITSLIEQIKSQQSLLKKIESVRESIKKQQQQINELLGKIDSFSSFDADFELSDESKIVLNLLKTKLGQMADSFKENNDLTACQFGFVLEALKQNELNEKTLLIDKANELSQFVVEQANSVKEIQNSLIVLVSRINDLISDKAETLQSSIYSTQQDVNSLAKETKQSFASIEERETNNKKEFNKFKLTIFLCLGGIGAVVLAILFLIIFKVILNT